MDDLNSMSPNPGKQVGRLIIALAMVFACWMAPSTRTASAEDPTGNAPKGVVLPNGRTISPAGNWIQLSPFPFSLAVRRDGSQIVVPSLGWPFSLNIIDNPADRTPEVRRIPPITSLAESVPFSTEPHLRISSRNDPNVQVHMNVAYSKDGSLLYDPTGDSGAVDVYRTSDWHQVARISLDSAIAGKNYEQSFASSVFLSADGRTLFALDQGNWRVVVIDLGQDRPVASVPAGVNPLGIALSPDSSRLYIANSGLFEYKLVRGIDLGHILETGLRFPPFGYPSKAARDGITVEGHEVPGLGDENNPRGSSLWTYDVSSPQSPRLTATLRLGGRIAERPNGVVGGASPSAVAADTRQVYVSLTHDDSIAVVSPDGAHLEHEIPLSPEAAWKDKYGRPLRGVMPFGLALAEDRLYVAESGINSVAVIDTDRNRVLAHIPVGQYPAALQISPDKRILYVVNNKGKGSGPNDGHHHIGELEFGSLSVISLPIGDEDFAAFTASVIRNNNAAITRSSPLPHLDHLFFIIRENRSFDEIFGDLPNANGDSRLARYGMHGSAVVGWKSETDGKPELGDVPVTPDAHALAGRFAISDNFYLNSEVSVDGHRWAVEMPPAPWLNLAWITGYSGRRHGNWASAAPGRRAIYGGEDGPMPEDEPEFGSLWEHVANAGLPLVNYGEGLEIEGDDEAPGTEPEGQRLVLNAPVPEPVFVATDRNYPGFNMGIPDQYRYDEFLRDFTRRSKTGYKAALTVIRLPNDHTGEPRPADGYPYRSSFVADNDLALGKIVDTISHSAIWKDSAIFVIEDDSQGGADHVDAHRSPLLVISPYARRGYISHRHTSMSSVHRTIYELLNLGPLNLEDALSADLSDMFRATPDLTPFAFVPEDKRIFDPLRARLARPKTAEERARMLDCDDSPVIARQFHKPALISPQK